jgi:hypothetical protein
MDDGLGEKLLMFGACRDEANRRPLGNIPGFFFSDAPLVQPVCWKK